MTTTPDTVVLIHGFWVTPRSWEHWITHYEQRGYRVVAPAYPGFEVEVDALTADPSPVEAVTVPQIVAHLEDVVGGLSSPPILMGHSAGGVFTQILLDHGFGAAGVAINSAPTEGVAVVPLSQLRSTFPVLKNPANRHKAVGFTHEQALRVHQHLLRRGVTGAVRALPHPGLRPDLLGQRAGQHPPGARRQLCRLRQPRPRPAAVRRRHRGPPDAAEGAVVEREALPRRPADRGRRVQRAAAPAARRPGLGGHRRLRPGVGGASRQDRHGQRRSGRRWRRDAVEVCRLLGPRTAIPVHYEGWTHFRHGREAITRAFADAPDVSAPMWLPIGHRVQVAT